MADAEEPAFVEVNTLSHYPNMDELIPSDEIIKQMSEKESKSSDSPPNKKPSVQQEYRCTELNGAVKCSYTTKIEERLIRHIRMSHRGENPFQCTMCDYSTYNKALFEEHIRIHKGIKPFKCSFCPYRSASKKNTKKHELIHRSDNPLRCKECDFIAKHKRSLRVHSFKHSSFVACKKCDFKTDDPKSLNIHEKLHTHKAQFQCEDCNARFSVLKYLIGHRRKKRKCELCDECFCSKTQFSRHMASSHGEVSHGVYGCVSCSWASSHKGRALLHYIHHPQPTTPVS